MEDIAFLELVDYHDRQLHIKTWQICTSETLTYRWHHHEELELLYILRGSLDLLIEQETFALSAGDVVLVGSEEFHTSRKTNQEEVVYIVLHVDLEPFFSPGMMMYYTSFRNRRLSRLNYMFRENESVRVEAGAAVLGIYTEMKDKKRGYDIATAMHIKRILLTLIRHDGNNELPMKPKEIQLQLIMDYVERNLSGKISMNEISHLANMSYHHFSRFFKKTIGVSFMDYVNRARIKKAERLLLAKDESITRVAESVGISNMAHFYDLFKRYNDCSPKEYIRRHDGFGKKRTGGAE